MRLSTHSGRLERWMPREHLEQISRSMKDWPGPPIAMAGIPGEVYARAGGDFVGPIAAGGFANYVDHMAQRKRRALRRWSLAQSRTMNAGFSDLTDLITKSRSRSNYYAFNKTGATPAFVGVASSYWAASTAPAAGSYGAAAPGGTVYNSASVGALGLNNANVSGETQHFAGAEIKAPLAVANRSLLLYDRLFAVAKTASSVVAEAVTGVPTRYQSSTPTDPDYAGGNFCSIEATASTGATAHNWTVCQYTDEAGNAGVAFPSVAGRISVFNGNMDLPVGSWFLPFAAGTCGVKALTQMQSDASNTGVVSFFMGHPIAFMGAPIAGSTGITDGINSAFCMTRIFDNAALALIELCVDATTSAASISGFIRTVTG